MASGSTRKATNAEVIQQLQTDLENILAENRQLRNDLSQREAELREVRRAGDRDRLIVNRLIGFSG